MSDLQHSLAIRLWSLTPEQAQSLGICIRCREELDLKALHPIDRAEYRLSALCPTCFETIMWANMPEEEDCD